MYACGHTRHNGACVKVRVQFVGVSFLESSGLAASAFTCRVILLAEASLLEDLYEQLQALVIPNQATGVGHEVVHAQCYNLVLVPEG